MSSPRAPGQVRGYADEVTPRAAGKAVPFTAEEIARAWHEALEVWGVAIQLSPPEALARRGAEHWGGEDPLAYIDLKRRQVVVNFQLLDEIGARGSLTAVLAHEIGHHVRHPHTLGLLAPLELLEKRLIPGLGESLTNLFFDLLINEHVGRARAAELAAVYAGFTRREGAEEPSPLFWLYLAVYEELWSMPPGGLVPQGSDATMEGRFPGCRAEARIFAQTFFALPDVYLAFVYFLSVFARYLPDPKVERGKMPLSRDLPSPDLDDYAGAIYGNPQVERALEEAAGRGWLSDENEGAGAAKAPDPLAAIGQVTSGRPGKEQKEFKQALVSRHYKRLVDQHLITIPATVPPPDPLIPTTFSEWESGDDPRRIDWTASVLASAALAPVRPLARDLEPEPPSESSAGSVAVEIYLDTSGSMPDPQTSLNAMTLAAQILAASAIRKGGVVRSIIYSMDAVVSDWLYDEERARRALLFYSGGGTRFPFDVLARLAGERADVIRVIITDADFLANLKEKGAGASLFKGVRASRRTVTMLALDEQWSQKVDQALGNEVCGLPQLRVVFVPALDRFADMAADLARALFGR